MGQGDQQDAIVDVGIGGDGGGFNWSRGGGTGEVC